MPYIITKKNGKKWNWPAWAKPLPNSEVEKFARDGERLGDCWTLVSPVTRRAIKVGACKKPTPSELWGARRGLGFWPFTKKKPKRRVGDARIYFVPSSRGGTRTINERAATVMRGARRRRKRR